MDPVRGIFIILHLIGLTGLLGGFLAQVREPVKRVTRLMLDGTWTMIFSGIVLSVLAYQDDRLIHPKIEIKTMVALATALLLWSSRKKESLDSGLYYAIGLLAMSNVVVAVLWQ